MFLFSLTHNRVGDGGARGQGRSGVGSWISTKGRGGGVDSRFKNFIGVTNSPP